MEFREWVSARFTENALTYRMQLRWVTAIVTQHCTGSVGLNPGQFNAMCELLRGIPVPQLGKYPGDVSAEDREWFATCLKPKYPDMYRYAEDKLKTLCRKEP